MQVPKQDIQRSARRALALMAGALIFNIVVGAVVLLWGIPWFGPLLIPAGVLSVIAFFGARDAWRANRTASSMTLAVEEEALVIDAGERYARGDVRFEVRPWVILVQRVLPPGFAELPWAEKKPYMAPLRSLYLPDAEVEALMDTLREARIAVEDRRAMMRWGMAWIYGLTVAVVLALVAWRLVLMGGLAAIVVASDGVGDLLGVHPAVVFFACAGFCAVFMGVYALWRRTS